MTDKDKTVGIVTKPGDSGYPPELGSAFRRFLDAGSDAEVEAARKNIAEVHSSLPQRQKDKTVGGRIEGPDFSCTGAAHRLGSLDKCWCGFEARLIAALTDAHSRGLRDGLERAATDDVLWPVLWRWAQAIPPSNLSTGTLHRLLTDLKAALRAEASKLDGEEPKAWPPPPCQTCGTPTWVEAPAWPEPPAEERKLPLEGKE
jgi:hypothetical protein